MQVRQFFEKERLNRGNVGVVALQPIDEAAWIWMPGQDVANAMNCWQQLDMSRGRCVFCRFRNDFETKDAPLRLHVSADERFVLLLDGVPFARGPHRGDIEHWYYQSYEISGLAAGPHRLEAVCWQLGENAPIAQRSWGGGFILMAEGVYDGALTTGKANWRVAPLHNTALAGCGTSEAYGAGTQFSMEGTGFEDEIPQESEWREAQVVRGRISSMSGVGARARGWMLFPTERPDQMEAVSCPGRIVNSSHCIDRPFVVPPHEEFDLWWDLENYVCAFPELDVAEGKGAIINWGWTESLRDADGHKANRAEWKGKSFSQMMDDTFKCDGRNDARFTTPWWRCGRWCRLVFKTEDEPLHVNRVAIRETHYPLSFDASFSCSDRFLDDVSRICRRTMEMCIHEMMFDGPYYEQQMYPGDSRVQLQILNSQTRDERMARFAMGTFDYARRDNGMVPMNFPTRGTQESATYTLCWILMFRDYLMWHDDCAFLKAHLPGVRHSLMGIEQFEDEEGLLAALPGWSFMDWVDGRFANGVPPGESDGQGGSSIVNLMYLLALKSVVDVEKALGQERLAAHWEDKAEKLEQTILERFWDEARGMVADSADHACFSEHAQILAILCDILSPEQRARAFEGLTEATDLAHASAYFCYYLFEAYVKCGRADLLERHWDDWRKFLEWNGFTTFEVPDCETRSDCHAWSACPLYFFQTALAGVTPASPFFQTVRIAPQPGALEFIHSRTPCPQGCIELHLVFKNGGVIGTVRLPEHLTGTFEWKGRSMPLNSGTQTIEM